MLFIRINTKLSQKITILIFKQTQKKTQSICLQEHGDFCRTSLGSLKVEL